MCDKPKLKVTEQLHAAFVREAEDMLQRCREDAAYHAERVSHHSREREGYMDAIRKLKDALNSIEGWEF